MKSKLLFIVMTLSILSQITGTAVGCPPTPPVAIIEASVLVDENPVHELWQDDYGNYYAVVYVSGKDDTIRLDASSSIESRNGTLSYQWDIDDGSGYVDGNITKDDWEPTEGVYTIKLRVTESGTPDASDEDEICVIVQSRRVHNVTQDKDIWYHQIQHAIKEAADDDDIIVNQGTYFENINFLDKNITVSSSDPTNWSVVANTIINSYYSDTGAVFFDGDEASGTKLEGFTITNDGSSLESGLEGHWKMDDMADDADVADSSGNNRDGTLDDNVSDHTSDHVSDGMIDSALSFDGDDDYVDIDHAIANPVDTSFSVFAWVRLDEKLEEDLQVIVQQKDDEDPYGRTLLLRRSDDKLGTHLSGTGLSSNTTVFATTGVWRHVGIVYNYSASKVTFYVDGREDGDHTCVGESTTGGYLLGSQKNSRGRMWNGLIDDVRIYDGVLSDAKISALASIRPSKIAHWKLDESESTDTTASDTSGGHHGEWESLGENPDWVAGKIGNALGFDDEEEEYIQIDDDEALRPNNYSWSVGFWMKSTDASQSTLMISKRQNATPFEQYSIGISEGDSYGWGTGEKIAFLFRENNTGDCIGGYTYNNIDFSQWTHVFVVLDKDGETIEDTVKVYIDGVEELVEFDIEGDFPDIDNTDDLFIGGNPDCLDHFKGELDDVRIYNEALTGRQIRQVYVAGSGIYGNGVIGAQISNCIIGDCTSKINGGGINDFDGDIINCVITGNTAAQNGGGLADCDGKITNCIIAHNDADTGGGLDDCDAQIINCTIVKNNATTANEGGGLNDCDTTNNTNAEITNCIIYANQANDSDNQLEGCLEYPAYSCIQGWTNPYSPDPDTTNNISSSPLFVDSWLNNNTNATDITNLTGPDGVFGTIDDGLRLRYGSVCIDVGDNSAMSITEDIAGKTRKMDVAGSTNGGSGTAPIVDMGAYESPAVFYVVKDLATGSHDGTSWDDAYAELSDALTGITVPSYGCEIWVAAGTYTPDTSFRTNDLQMIQYAELYGGFDGVEECRIERDLSANETTLSGDIGTDDSYTVVRGADDAILNGFTVKDAVDDGSGQGYGIWCEKTSPTIQNCLILDNICGIYCDSDYLGTPVTITPVIMNCTIVNNSGYGIQCDSPTYSQPVITNCILWNNGDDLDGCTASYSCIEDGDLGDGNISWKPYFENESGGDYTLKNYSQCIGAGDSDSDSSREPAGGNGRISMGAYGNTKAATTYVSTDSDTDGLLDDWETDEFGDTTSNDGDGDSDDDGILDTYEYMFGTDPEASTSFQVGSVSVSTPQIDPAWGETVTVSFYLNKADDVKVGFLNTDETTPTFEGDIEHTGAAGLNTVTWNGTTDNSTGNIVERAFYHIQIQDDTSNPIWTSKAAGTTSPQAGSEDKDVYDDEFTDDTHPSPRYRNTPVALVSDVTDWARRTIDIVIDPAEADHNDDTIICNVMTDGLLVPNENLSMWYGRWDNGGGNGKIAQDDFDVYWGPLIGVEKGAILVNYFKPLSSLKCNPYRIIASNNEITTFSYYLTYDSDVTIKIYTFYEKLFHTINLQQTAGFQSVTWDGRDSTGEYISNEGVYRIDVLSDRMSESEKVQGTLTVYK